MTGLSRCGNADSFRLASDGRFWPAGYLDCDDGTPGGQSWDGGWNDEP